MLCPAEMAAVINAISIAIAEGKTINQLSTLSVIFDQIADTLATIAVQKQNIENCEAERKKRCEETNFEVI